MTTEINSTLEYEIHNLVLVTKYGNYDIRNIFLELNIYDHILYPCMSGNIVMLDSTGLINKLSPDGSEFILMDISKKDKQLRIKKAFHIFKMTDRKSKSSNSESYVLHFISDEFVYSQQKTINRSFRGKTYSEIVSEILTRDLKVNDNRLNGLFHKSSRMKDVVIPGMNPLEAINWCSKRAVNSEFLSDFFFYENAIGYNFASLTELKKKDPIFDVNFTIKNIEASKSLEMFGVRDFEIVVQYDYIESIKSGVFAGTFIGYDPITRTVVEQKISYDDIIGNINFNKNSKIIKTTNRDGKTNLQEFDAKRRVFPAALGRTNNSYIRNNDPSSLSLNETPEFFVLQRESMIKNLFAKRLKIILPGNFSVTCGVNLNIKKPKNSSYEEDNNIDKSIYGKYLVVATRHMIRANQHETVVELVSDSLSSSSMSEIDVNIKEVLKYG